MCVLSYDVQLDLGNDAPSKGIVPDGYIPIKEIASQLQKLRVATFTELVEIYEVSC